jgi:hypothetical protein
MLERAVAMGAAALATGMACASPRSSQDRSAARQDMSTRSGCPDTRYLAFVQQEDLVRTLGAYQGKDLKQALVLLPP